MLNRSLVEQIQQIETQQGRIGEAIIEIQKRIEVFDEVMPRNVPGEEPKTELPLDDIRDVDAETQDHRSAGRSG